MRDGGVGQHALDVLLAKSGQIADRHREHGDDPEQRLPNRAQRGKHLIRHAQQQSEGSGFWAR